MVRVYSYGSNSVSQLRARVENCSLTASPARALNWQRIFCFYGARWCGTAASLSPCEGAVVYGAVVDLTAEELARLDKFEGGYDQQTIEVNLFENNEWSSPVSSIVYIARQSRWEGPPSEQYLTAIHIMLEEQFHSEIYAAQIDVCGKLEDKVEKFYTWKYPGSIHLSIPSLCVEVNARRSSKWVMPQSMHTVVNELNHIGVHSSAQLAVWISKKGICCEDDVATNAALAGSQFNLIDREAVLLFKELLQI